MDQTFNGLSLKVLHINTLKSSGRGTTTANVTLILHFSFKTSPLTPFDPKVCIYLSIFVASDTCNYLVSGLDINHKYKWFHFGDKGKGIYPY